jgi:hypothetical protein
VRARRIAFAALLLLVALAGLARAETAQHGTTRVHFDGALTPSVLPRHGAAAVKVSFSARIEPVHNAPPPQLRALSIAINRHGRFQPAGLPRCTVSEIQPTTTADALRACRPSLVGQGYFTSKVILPQASPFPSAGKVYAFNGTYRGHPAILAHVYGTTPLPTSYTIPFTIDRAHGKTYGTTLRASLPGATSEWGYVTGLRLTIGRSFRSHGQPRSYITASCPTPAGVRAASFPFAKASFSFAKSKPLHSTLTRACRGRS